MDDTSKLASVEAGWPGSHPPSTEAFKSSMFVAAFGRACGSILHWLVFFLLGFALGIMSGCRCYVSEFRALDSSGLFFNA